MKPFVTLQLNIWNKLSSTANVQNINTSSIIKKLKRLNIKQPGHAFV